MSRLNDVIQEVISELRDDEGNVCHALAANLVVSRADDEGKEVLMREGAVLRCKKAAVTGRKSMEANARVSAQLFLFPTLRAGYALDVEGHTIKSTEYLKEMEFRRIIAIREKQLVDDRRHLEELRAAYDAVHPVWRQHPDWTFGECCTALRSAEVA